MLEARDRIGGRIHTDDGLGMSLDLGAAWIHGPEGNPISALAELVGAERVETDDTYVVRGAQGRRLGILGTPAWLEEVVSSTQAGVESAELNPRWLTEVYPVHGIGSPGRDVKFPGGYGAVLEAVAGDYSVRLSTPVAGISLGDGEVQVTPEGGASEAFEAVLVTVPLGVLKVGSLAFDPPLPIEKTAAIERMGMGLLDKLYLVFDEAFRDPESLILTPENGLPPGQFNYWVNLHRYLDVPVLVALNGAGPALELAAKTDQEVLDMALQTLRSA